MKHLIKINEWKNEEDCKLDKENIQELNDLFLPITDLGCENFYISIDQHIAQAYNVFWTLPIDLNINESRYFEPNHRWIIDSESIKKHKEKLIKFNNLQDETHDVLERLLTIGYKVYYYTIDVAEMLGSGNVLKFQIRVKR